MTRKIIGSKAKEKEEADIHRQYIKDRNALNKVGNRDREYKTVL